MAPAVVIDNTPDLDMDSAPTPAHTTAGPRTLLLAPASVAAHPDALTKVSQAYDRNATDIQMLDRLALGLVSLPASTYDLILLLTDVAPSPQSNGSLLNRDVIEALVASLKAGGRLQSQDGTFGQRESAEKTEAILAGLVADGGNGMLKPQSSGEGQTVKLSFGKKKAQAAAVPANPVEAAVVESRQQAPIRSTPAGVGFIENDTDLDGGYEDEDEDVDFPTNEELENAGTIDPDTLLTDADRQKPLNIRK